MAEFVFDDNYFMREALKEAQKAFDAGEIPIGAVVVCQNRIVARAHNQTERLRDVTAHAEILAFTSAYQSMNSKFLEECTLYVTVEPCMMCAGATFWSRIGRLVYGAAEPKYGYTRLQQEVLHPKTEVTTGVMAEDCAALMKAFFQHKRKG